MLHFAGQFKVHTQANIYLYTAVSDGYFKRIVGFKPRVVIIGAHKQPAECCGWIKPFVLYLILAYFFQSLGFFCVYQSYTHHAH